MLVYAIYRLHNSSEGFALTVETPSQEYTIPELRGIAGRYVRIRPSLTNGDGYLSISQIMVMGVDGQNVALKRPASATSQGGSPLDQKYGKQVLYSGIYRFEFGVSDGPLCVTDGVLTPRRGLTNIFETSVQNKHPGNTSLPDTQWLEIDLGSNVIINSVVYIGRGDAQTRTIETIDSTFDNLTQEDRLNGMRLEIRDTHNVLIYPGRTNTGLFPTDKGTTKQTLEIGESLYGVNLGLGSAGSQKQSIQIPNIASYKAFAKTFKVGLFPSFGNQCMLNTVYKNKYSSVKLDISNNVFPNLLGDAPISFYNDIYLAAGCPSAAGCPGQATTGCYAGPRTDSATRQTITPVLPGPRDLPAVPPALSPSLSIDIFGYASPNAIAQMNQSILLCSKLYLGAPAIVEQYVRLSYNATDATQIKAYLRGTCTSAHASTNFCVSDLIQVFQGGGFVTTAPPAHATWNAANCTCLLTGDSGNGSTILGLLPFAARNFIVEWIANRTQRYTSYTAIATRSTTLPPAPPYIPIPSYVSTSSPIVLNAIAQQFYELLGGQFAMTYIYDALPLGSTMIDVRFDLYIHDDTSVSNAAINQLKAQYNRIVSAQTQSQDVIDQANIDYKFALAAAETKAIGARSNPFQGAVARLFYTPSGRSIVVSGIIFDEKAVTSFIPELNGGMIVPLGPSPGNVNFQPTTVFTKNQVEPLVCSDPATLKRVMSDYVEMVSDPTLKNPPLLNAEQNPIDVSKGILTPIQILGAQQVSPTQCALTWTESLYDPQKNTPIVSNGSNSGSGIITRNGIISYKTNTEEWNAINIAIDISGFRLYPDANVPRCVFDPEVYKFLRPGKFTATTSGSTVTADFLTNSFNDGLGPVCPLAIPNYIFNSANAGGMTKQEFISRGIYSGTVLRPATPIARLATPVSITKPLPYSATLDTLSGICPPANCQDIDILYTLVDQYNSDPTMPGTIIKVTHAFTPNPSQCDVRVAINYDSMIENIVGTPVVDPLTNLNSTVYKKVKKGTVTYSAGSGATKLVEGSKPMPYSGIYSDSTTVSGSTKSSITLALYVAPDPSTCAMRLVDASGQNSGRSIQPNTPALYTPMIYATELIKRSTGALGSSIDAVVATATTTLGSSKPTLKNYRINTYNTAGAANILNSCNLPCSDSAVQQKMMAYYKRVADPLQIDTVLNTSSPDGQSCHATFTNTSQQTITGKFSFTPTCSVSGFTTSITGQNSTQNPPMPSDEQILDIRKELATTLGSIRSIPYKNPEISYFTNYSPSYIVAPEALDVRAFGQDVGRNSEYHIHDAQFQTPLVQELPAKQRRVAPNSYKFLRFSPTQLRSPTADGVAVGKFIFFFDGYPLFLKGSVSNPMGTWEGTVNDVIGPGHRPGWFDTHKKPLVFAFRDPIAVDAYTWTTATPERAIDCDPISWKLEGSANGTFWTVLDVQERFPTPVERFTDLDKLYLKS